MRLSLRQVLDGAAPHGFAGGVHIPLIQRDYAHGREDAKDLRERFLEAISAALAERGESLDLDFIYGTRGADDALLPLDGQQRLTTLFLVHWYLAHRDGALADFRSYANRADASLFSYRVRPSSRRFFDALVTRDFDLRALPEGEAALSATLRDQAWFFESWRLDPTVAACLETLDSVHRIFQDSAGSYARLVQFDDPPITFQFLELDHFGLSDDLYIKMNARGKPLTPFETFKANLEGHIGEICAERTAVLGDTEVALQTYVAQRFDTAWADLFWGLRRDDLDQDAQTMNAIRAIALVTAPRPVEADAHAATNSQLQWLRGDDALRFFDYLQRGCLTAEFVDALTLLFDRWAERMGEAQPFLTTTGWYDERAVFARALQRSTAGRERFARADSVMFSAWCDYLLSELPVDGVDAWMRVVSNLTHNRIYDRPDQLRSSLLACQRLLDEMIAGRALLNILAEGATELTGGFARQQIREERIKAQLLQRAPEWRPLIEQAEMHGYFRGQIEFLLDFSGVLAAWSVGERCDWDDAQDATLRVAFAQWFVRADAVFDGDGLRAFDDFVWERALLCEGGYLLANRSNHGFLDNSRAELSWKRLLRADLNDDGAQRKRGVVRTVLAELDLADVAGSLQRRIDQGVNVIEGEHYPGWRNCLVECPALIAYCGKRQIRMTRKHGERIIFLLSKVQRNGNHKELFGAWLAARFSERRAAGEYAPFNRSEVDEACFDAESYGARFWVRGKKNKTKIEVYYSKSQIQIYVPEILHAAGEPTEVWVDVDQAEAELDRQLRATIVALGR